uniref:Uncharacterized protein n=1 Tax=Laurencia australis TaxID=3073067 RepID=A0AA51NEG6_9FLOR|nr:hypothetical protein [Laurencia australis]WMP11949.1 hypothetical protein [Laurencia australis]
MIFTINLNYEINIYIKILILLQEVLFIYKIRKTRKNT